MTERVPGATEQAHRKRPHEDLSDPRFAAAKQRAVQDLVDL